MRDRVALVLLGTCAVICLVYAWDFAAFSLRAASVPLTFAALHLLVALGLHRKHAAAHGLGMGLGMSGVFFLILLWRIGFSFEPSQLLVVFLPALLALTLARKDDTPPLIRVVWLLAGATLLPIVFIGYDALYCSLDGGNAHPLALAAVPLALTGAWGLARSRTWGLLAMGLGGALLFCAMPSPPVWGGIAMLATREVIRAVALGLIGVALLFAVPIWRFLRRPD